MSYDKKIFHERINYKKYVRSKINSFENFDHKPKRSNRQIFSQQLPWLYYNSPNLPEDEKFKINKKMFNYEDNNQHFDRSKQKSYDESLHDPLYQRMSGIEYKLAQISENSCSSNQSLSPVLNKSNKIEKSEDKPHVRFKQATNIKPKTEHKSTSTDSVEVNESFTQTDTLESIYQMNKMLNLALSSTEPISIAPQLRKVSKAVENINIAPFDHQEVKQEVKQEVNTIKHKPKKVNQKPPATIKPIIQPITVHQDNYLTGSIGDYDDDDFVNDDDKLPINVTHASTDYLDRFWADKRNFLIQHQVAGIKKRASQNHKVAAKVQPIPYSSYIDEYYSKVGFRKSIHTLQPTRPKLSVIDNSKLQKLRI